MELNLETRIFPRMVALAECLCEENTNSGLPDLCFCGVIPGASVAYDVDGCLGMAFVRLVSVYPSSSFPEPDAGGTCGTMLAAILEVGIMRGYAVMDEEGNAPDTAAALEAVGIQMSDMAAIRRAISCCSLGPDLILGPYTPYGPDGAVVGGVWQVTISDLR